jgi:ankyrin repeat protein
MSGLLCAWLANEKGRDGWNWFFLGSLLGIFALVALGLSPSLKANSGQIVPYKRADNGDDYDTGTPLASETTKKCPDCVEMIKIEARKCRYCGREFTEEDVERSISEHQRELEELKAEEERAEEIIHRSSKLEHDKRRARSGLDLLGAIQLDDAQEVSYLLSLGADPNKCVRGEGHPLGCAISRKNVDIAKILLDNGASTAVDPTSFFSDTFLHKAIRVGSSGIANILIQHRADARKRNILCQTPLSIALRKRDKSPEGLRLLEVLLAAPIWMRCRKCKKILRIPSELRGQSGSCTHCGAHLTVPK